MGLFLLRSFFSNGATMKVNTALLIITCGSSLILLNADKQKAAIALFTAAGVLSLLILGEHIFHISIGIDEWWFRDKDASLLREPPGRTFVLTSVGILSICILTLLAVCKKYYISQFPGFTLFLLLYAALMGHFFGATGLYRQGSYSGIALHTTIGLLLLNISTFLYQLRNGWLRLFSLKIVGNTGPTCCFTC